MCLGHETDAPHRFEMMGIFGRGVKFLDISKWISSNLSAKNPNSNKSLEM